MGNSKFSGDVPNVELLRDLLVEVAVAHGSLKQALSSPSDLLDTSRLPVVTTELVENLRQGADGLVDSFNDVSRWIKDEFERTSFVAEKSSKKLDLGEALREFDEAMTNLYHFYQGYNLASVSLPSLAQQFTADLSSYHLALLGLPPSKLGSDRTAHGL